MAKLNTIPIRSDAKFKNLIDTVLKTKPRSIKSPRVTLAIVNQYKKYPQLLKELMEADLKNE